MLPTSIPPTPDAAALGIIHRAELTTWREQGDPTPDLYNDHMTRQLTATEAKVTLLALLDEVAAGEEIEITKHGHTVAGWRRRAALVPSRGGWPTWHGRRVSRPSCSPLARRGTPRYHRAPGHTRRTLVVGRTGETQPAAAGAIDAADELAVRDPWYELAWLAKHERIELTRPVRTWLGEIRDVRTVGITPAIADTAAALSSAFPGDPADRIIYATAIELGWTLLTKDRALRSHRHPSEITLW